MPRVLWEAINHAFGTHPYLPDAVRFLGNRKFWEGHGFSHAETATNLDGFSR
jgi:hypothetical protein